MKKKITLSLLSISLILFTVTGLVACANRGSGPQGGPRDRIPPVVLQSTPENGALRVNQNKIVIEFDELVKIENPGKNILISPPQKQMPTIKAKGKKVIVVLEDSLLKNTTYSIDFGNAIVDLNERNVLENYSFFFSTGDKIDSLQIGGKVINALTLSPCENFTVGVYRNAPDSAFLTRPFERIAKTNKEGLFTIRNIAAGSYKLYALNDVGQSNYYSQKGSEIAFADSIIIPEAHLHGTFDTLWRNPEKTAYDSVIVNAFYKYYPNDVELRSFREKTVHHFLKKQERNVRGQVSFIFNEIQPQPFQWHWVGDSIPADSLGMIQEHMQRADSLNFWITDSTLYQKDTLFMAIEYIEGIEGNELKTIQDTVELIYQEKKGSSRYRTPVSTSPHLYSFTHNLNRNLEVYDTIHFDFSEPILDCQPDSIHLFKRKDTVEIPVPVVLQYDYEPCPKRVYFLFKKEFGASYQLRVDSAAFHSWYGKANDAFNKPIQIRSLEEYANLYIQFPKVPQNAMVQLLNTNGGVIQESEILEHEAFFEDIEPGTYQVRLFIDSNQNKKWDTGNYSERRQAEKSYLFPKKLNLRPNWDVEEKWNPIQ